MKLRLLLVAAVALTACSSEDNSTTGKRITLQTAVAPSDRATFTTGFGWDVTLTKAALATSGLYYFDGPPATALYVPRKKGIGDYLIGTAHAHPGHYQAGTALGQVLLAEPAALDLFAAAPVTLAPADAVTGTYRSARVVLPQASPGDAVMMGHLALVEGKALKKGDTAATPIYFRLVADYADVSQSVLNGAIDGCILDEAVVTEAGTVTLSVRPAVWLNLVDFSKIAAGTEAAPTEAKDVGFSQGVTQLSAYRFSYARP